MNKDFESFVREAVKEDEGHQKFDAQKEINIWTRKLDELIHIARQSRDSFIADGTLGFAIEPFPMREEQLGAYEAKRVRIVLGSKVAELKPVGSMMVGARGRVDLIGRKGVARIVLAPADTIGFSVPG